jgi:hypothetical protein
MKTGRTRQSERHESEEVAKETRETVTATITEIGRVIATGEMTTTDTRVMRTNTPGESTTAGEGTVRHPRESGTTRGADLAHAKKITDVRSVLAETTARALDRLAVHTCVKESITTETTTGSNDEATTAEVN